MNKFTNWVFNVVNVKTEEFNGKSKTTIRLAENRYRKLEDGTFEKMETIYIDGIRWNVADEFLEKLQNASKVMIDGYLRFDEWETEEGSKRNKLYIQIERLKVLEVKKIEEKKEQKKKRGKKEKKETVEETAIF